MGRDSIRDQQQFVQIQNLRSLLRRPDFGNFDLKTLKKAYYGASIMPVPVGSPRARQYSPGLTQ